MDDTSLIQLSNRGLLGISGADAQDFLQGVITSDLRRVAPSRAIYAAHLTPQGRFLFDFFVYDAAAFADTPVAEKLEEAEILIDCAYDERMELAQSLHRFAVGRKVDFHDLSDVFSVFATLPGPETTVGVASETPGHMQVDEQGIAILTDPRTVAMGLRHLFPKASSKALASEKAGDMATYETHRLACGVADGRVDVLKNRTLANEFGLEALNGVSFDKGCYVGQELTARTKFRTEPKKKMMKVGLSGRENTPLPLATPIVASASEAGWLFTNDGTQGLAILRTRYVEEGAPLEAAGRSVVVLAG